MTDEKALLQDIENAISGIEYSSTAPELYKPIAYGIAAGGKRLRPMLCMRCCEGVGADPAEALNQALAVELFHNFTLVHDDVMDNSDTRRGRPTVFKKWGVPQAILSGDAMLTMATIKAADCRPKVRKTMLGIFNDTALLVYEGQQLDMDYENRDDVELDDYLKMIMLKTGTLFGCSCAMGAIAGGASLETADALNLYGEYLGMVFQLRDDWLDTFGDAETFGKPIGGDILNRKKTFFHIIASHEAPAELAEAYKTLQGKELIERVQEIYRSLKLSSRCRSYITKYSEAAVAQLEAAEISQEVKTWLADLIEQMRYREK